MTGKDNHNAGVVSMFQEHVYPGAHTDRQIDTLTHSVRHMRTHFRWEYSVCAMVTQSTDDRMEGGKTGIE